LKDESLAQEIADIETEDDDSVEHSRARIFAAIERRYTASS